MLLRGKNLRKLFFGIGGIYISEHDAHGHINSEMYIISG